MSKEENKKKYNSDITAEDKQALNEKGRSMNKGQDKDLDREQPVDFTADSMDIPGSNQNNKKDNEELVDEENYRFNKKGTSDKKKDLDDLPDPDTKKDN